MNYVHIPKFFMSVIVLRDQFEQWTLENKLLSALKTEVFVIYS
jgi:hypothetical protein